MSNTASTISIIAALVVVVGGQYALLRDRIAGVERSLGKRVDDLHADVRELRSTGAAIDRRLARIEGRLGVTVEDEGKA